MSRLPPAARFGAGPAAAAMKLMITSLKDNP
jgi:hypothetical protein